MNRFDRPKAQEAYVQHTLDNCSANEIESIAFDFLMKEMNDMTDEELITDLSTYYPKLLEDNVQNTDGNGSVCSDEA